MKDILDDLKNYEIPDVGYATGRNLEDLIERAIEEIENLRKEAFRKEKY